MLTALVLSLTAPTQAMELPLNAGGPSTHIVQIAIGDHEPSMGILWGGRGYGTIKDSPFRVGGMGAATGTEEEATFSAELGFGGPTLGYAFPLAEGLKLPVTILTGFGGASEQIVVASSPPNYGKGAKVVTESSGLLGVLGTCVDVELALSPGVALAMGATGFLGFGALPARGFGLGMSVMFGG